MNKSDNLKALATDLKKLANSLNRIAQGLDDQSPLKPTPKITSSKKKPAKAQNRRFTKTPTKTDIVLKTIRRARAGLDTTTLQKRTGFDKRTISNTVNKLKKENKIKSPKRGVYTKI